MSERSDPVLDELERIRNNNDGVLQAADVVEAAADVRNPLHSHFEWDNEKAGHEYRLQQARRLIRLKVKEIQSGDSRKIPTYFNTTKDGERGYRHVDDVIVDDELRAQAYRNMVNELHAMRRRLKAYTAYAEQVGPVLSAIDRALIDLEEGGEAA